MFSEEKMSIFYCRKLIEMMNNLFKTELCNWFNAPVDSFSVGRGQKSRAEKLPALHTCQNKHLLLESQKKEKQNKK